MTTSEESKEIDKLDDETMKRSVVFIATMIAFALIVPSIAIEAGISRSEWRQEWARWAMLGAFIVSGLVASWTPLFNLAWTPFKASGAAVVNGYNWFQGRQGPTIALAILAAAVSLAITVGNAIWLFQPEIAVKRDLANQRLAGARVSYHVDSELYGQPVVVGTFSYRVPLANALAASDVPPGHELLLQVAYPMQQGTLSPHMPKLVESDAAVGIRGCGSIPRPCRMVALDRVEDGFGGVSRMVGTHGLWGTHPYSLFGLTRLAVTTLIILATLTVILKEKDARGVLAVALGALVFQVLLGTAPFMDGILKSDIDATEYTTWATHSGGEGS